MALTYSMICISAIAIANMISLEMDMSWVVWKIERNSQETYSMWLLPNTIRQINDLVTLPSLSNTGADDPRSKSARLHIPMPNTLRLTMCAHSQLSILRLSSWTFTKEIQNLPLGSPFMRVIKTMERIVDPYNEIVVSEKHDSLGIIEAHSSGI